MNSLSSGSCPVSFLRWCWIVYLELEYTDIKIKQNLDLGELIKAKWNKSDRIWRLCCPLNIISKSMFSPSTSTLFIVSTSRADPLENDGIDLVSSLISSELNVVHHSLIGSHAIAYEFDVENTKKLMESWRKSIW